MQKTAAKPFLKWAGGKTQLLEEISKRIPEGPARSFVEPFIGGGAVFFHLNSRYSFDECHLFDSSPELIMTYSVLQNDAGDLIDLLDLFQAEYLTRSEDERRDYYYSMRETFNRIKPKSLRRYDRGWVSKAAIFIFLNRTCYNGLFRVNSKGEFNVPAGSYKNPKILNRDLLLADSAALQNTGIHLGDFSGSLSYISEDSFVYFDPPYRPLNATSSFNSYSKGAFGDDEQRRLAGFFRKCDKKGAKLMLSNSDPKNVNPEDNFFDDLYDGFQIERIPAKRMINSNAGKRGEVSEILVTNF